MKYSAPVHRLGRTLDEVKGEVLSAAALLLEDVLLRSHHPVV